VISAIISFLGGSAFRMIWGEVSAFFSARQDHRFEVERMRLQGELDGAAHARNLEAIRVQAELGVKEVQVKAEADIGRAEAEGFYAALREAQKATGIFLVDLWNGVIRPLAASIAIALWVLALDSQGWKMGEWDKELVGVILGFFFASRELTKRGK
jgi:hypothetical protein